MHRSSMLQTFTLALLVLSKAAFAQDTSAAEGDASMIGVAVSTSYSISAPSAATTVEQSVLEDQQYRQQLYLLSAKECSDVLATIAKTCSVTNVSISTQVTRQPGLPNQMYASGTVTMTIEMK